MCNVVVPVFRNPSVFAFPSCTSEQQCLHIVILSEVEESPLYRTFLERISEHDSFNVIILIS